MHKKNYTEVYRLFTTPTTPWCGQPATSFIYNLQNIEFGISVRSPCFQYYKVKNKPKHDKFQGSSPHKVSLVYIESFLCKLIYTKGEHRRLLNK